MEDVKETKEEIYLMHMDGGVVDTLAGWAREFRWFSVPDDRDVPWPFISDTYMQALSVWANMKKSVDPTWKGADLETVDMVEGEVLTAEEFEEFYNTSPFTVYNRYRLAEVVKTKSGTWVEI